MKMSSKLLYSLIFAILLASCSHVGTRPSDKYYPFKISGKVLHNPHAVAWSPSGTLIAFLRNGLYVYDFERNRIDPVQVEVRNPYFLRWISESQVLVLFRENGKNVLGIVDMESSTLYKSELDGGADAAFERPGVDGIFIFFSKAEQTRIGTEASYLVSEFDLLRKESTEVYLASRMLYGRNYDAHRYSGWITTDQNPLDPFLVLLIEYVKPPMFPHHLKVNYIDSSNSMEIQTVRIEEALIYPDGSWSPNGMRIALADKSGRLRILNHQGRLSRVDDNMSGRYPSWNPAGSLIFFGGHILNSDGTEAETIAADNPESIALWSPDGISMALLLEDDLWVLGGFSPKFSAPDTPLDDELKTKLVVLRELLDGELISNIEFKERYMNLIKKDD